MRLLPVAAKPTALTLPISTIASTASFVYIMLRPMAGWATSTNSLLGRARPCKGGSATQ